MGYITFLAATIVVLPSIVAIAWKDLNSNFNGKIITAISSSVGVIISRNSGASWEQASVPRLTWNSISMSSDGQYLITSASKHGVYMSADHGTEWKKLEGLMRNGDTENWKSVKMSSSGQYMFACSEEGVYHSTDFGESWEKSLNVAGNWHAISMSENGQYGSVVGLGEGIYVTSDYGKTWRPTDAIPAAWIDIACGSDGKHCASVAVGEGIFTSEDYGQSWERSSAPDLAWKSVTCEQSGTTFVAASFEGIYRSINAGKDWVKTSNPSGKWSHVSLAGDGSTLYAVAEGAEKISESSDLGNTWDQINDKVLKEYQDLFTVQQEELKDSFKAVILDVNTDYPTSQPSAQPTAVPTSQPTNPTSQPTARPTDRPTSKPTSRPTNRPTAIPSSRPTAKPSASPTSRPTRSPSSQPSRQPSAQPTSQPSRPTFAPTAAPTFAPTVLVSQQVLIRATYTINNVINNTLTGTSLDAILEAIRKSTPQPATITIRSWVVVGPSSRRLEAAEAIPTPSVTTAHLRSMDLLTTASRNIIHTLATNLFTYDVDADINYNLVDFPGYNATTLSTVKTQQITQFVTNGTFQQNLRTVAAQNTALQLLNVTSNNVSTAATIINSPSVSHRRAQLTDGELAGIIIGVIIGSFLLILTLYCVMKDRRLGLAVNHEGIYKPSEETQQRDMVTVDDNNRRVGSDYVGDAMTMHGVDDEEHQRQQQQGPPGRKGQSTDLTDGYLQIRL